MAVEGAAGRATGSGMRWADGAEAGWLPSGTDRAASDCGGVGAAWLAVVGVAGDAVGAGGVCCWAAGGCADRSWAVWTGARAGASFVAGPSSRDGPPSSAMILRMEERISSIEGSFAAASAISVSGRLLSDCRAEPKSQSNQGPPPRNIHNVRKLPAMES